jgi:hypothetical protein
LFTGDAYGYAAREFISPKPGSSRGEQRACLSEASDQRIQ